MLIAFDNRKIRNICEEENEALSELSEQVVIKLKSRLADLAAATSVKDIIVGNPCEIINNSRSDYKIDLCDGYILIFAANHVNNPKMENGSIDWLKVKRIKILEIKERNE